MEPSRDLAMASGPLSGAAQGLATELDVESDARFAADQTMRIVFPDRVGDTRFEESILRSSVDKIDAMWRIIGGRDPLEATTPLAALGFAEAAASSGVQLSQFERAYRVGIGLVWLCWYRHALEHATRREQSLDELVGAPTMIIHAYIDGVLTPLMERFVEIRDEDGPRDRLQRDVLRQVLAGVDGLDADGAEEALGIGLAGEHLAFVVRSDRIGDVGELVAYAKGAAGATSGLVYRQNAGAHVIWLSAPEAFGARRLQRLRDALGRTGMPVALGEPGLGLAGLGSTGRDALEASRLQAMIGAEAAPVISFADVRLESLFLSDPERARRFVTDELGALDDGDASSARLRETVLAWLTTGSHVGAATHLGVHEHTVRRRIARAEDLLQGELSARRTELLVALRLKRILEGSAQPRSIAVA